MIQKRILVVDDEPDFAQFIAKILRDENFTVLIAADGDRGLRMARESHPDLIFLDWNLPLKDGVDVCKILKSDASTRDIPIIMLTLRGREADTVLALEVGADDYITKRVLRAKELVARARAAMRKSAPPEAEGEVLVSGDLVLDTARRRVTVKGEPVSLRVKEFDLLYVFMKRPGRVLNRNFLSESVWGDPYFGTTRTIDMTVGRLRGKLGRESTKIQSLKGLGYRFED